MTDTSNNGSCTLGPPDVSVQSFQVAVQSASKITIYWCPVVKQSNFTGSPQQERVWTDQICGEAAGELRTVPLTFNATSEPASLVASALQLVAEHDRVRLQASLMEILDAAEEGGWFDPGASGLSRGRGKLPGRGITSDRVVYAVPSLLGEVNGPSIVSAFLFSERSVSCRCSLGLYEEDSGEDLLPWSPEINIVATYDGVLLRAALHAGDVSLFGFLMHYCGRMFQRSVYIQLALPSADVQTWLFEYEHTRDAETGTGRARLLPRTNIWMLRQTAPTGWLRQFSVFRGHLRQGWTSRTIRERIRAEMREMRNATDTGREFVGATIESVPEDSGAMRVVVSGRARFFFESSLPPALEEADGPPMIDIPELILLHTENLGPGRDVLYAPYTGDPGISNRCLCGWNYPGAKSHRCDVATHGLVRHRARQAVWVEQAVRDHRGSGWGWRLLSSPHFYHSAEPEKLRADAPKETRKEEQRSALATTQAEWALLLNTFFCK